MSVTAHTGRTRRFMRGLAVVGALLCIGRALLGCEQPQVTAEATQTGIPVGAAGSGGVPTANPPAPGRTPFPTVVHPPTTPLPVSTTIPPRPRPTEQLQQPDPTADPDASCGRRVHAARLPGTAIQTQNATMIIIGTVKQVLPARWDTPDGRPPPDACSLSTPHNIFRPVLVEVEQYVKGEQPQRIVQVYSFGGQVGKDKTTYSPEGLYTFREGERVLLFLKETGRQLRKLGGRPLMDILGHYMVTPDGMALDDHRTIPVQQLLDEIAEAQKHPKAGQLSRHRGRMPGLPSRGIGQQIGAAMAG